MIKNFDRSPSIYFFLLWLLSHRGCRHGCDVVVDYQLMTDWNISYFCSSFKMARRELEWVCSFNSLVYYSMLPLLCYHMHTGMWFCVNLFFRSGFETEKRKNKGYTYSCHTCEFHFHFKSIRTYARQHHISVTSPQVLCKCRVAL